MYYCITVYFYVEGWFCSNTKACIVEEENKIRRQLSISIQFNSLPRVASSGDLDFALARVATNE